MSAHRPVAGHASPDAGTTAVCDTQIQVLVVVSPGPRQILQEIVSLPQETTVSEALKCSALAQSCLQAHPEELAIGVWGRKVQPGDALSNGDRLEIYRALRVDPKVARRERFRKQGSKAAGLFASRRPGAKPGY